MIFYIRNRQNKTIVDVELYEKEGFMEMSSSIMIEEYSYFLLSHEKKEDMIMIIKDFSFLDELRGWFYEYYLEMNDGVTYSQAIQQVRKVVKSYADKYELFYVED